MYKPVDSLLTWGYNRRPSGCCLFRAGTPSPSRRPRWKATMSEGRLVPWEIEPGDPACGCNVDECQRLTGCWAGPTGGQASTLGLTGPLISRQGWCRQRQHFLLWLTFPFSNPVHSGFHMSVSSARLCWPLSLSPSVLGGHFFLCFCFLFVVGFVCECVFWTHHVAGGILVPLP